MAPLKDAKRLRKEEGVLPHVAHTMKEAYGAFDLCHASVKKCPVAQTNTHNSTRQHRSQSAIYRVGQLVNGYPPLLHLPQLPIPV